MDKVDDLIKTMETNVFIFENSLKGLTYQLTYIEEVRKLGYKKHKILEDIEYNRCWLARYQFLLNLLNHAKTNSNGKGSSC